MVGGGVEDVHQPARRELPMPMSGGEDGTAAEGDDPRVPPSATLDDEPWGSGSGSPGVCDGELVSSAPRNEAGSAPHADGDGG